MKKTNKFSPEVHELASAFFAQAELDRCLKS